MQPAACGFAQKLEPAAAAAEEEEEEPRCLQTAVASPKLDAVVAVAIGSYAAAVLGGVGSKFASKSRPGGKSTQESRLLPAGEEETGERAS